MSSALLPQLDISTYWSQIFWLIVTFSVLYLSLSKVFLPNIMSLVKRRQDYMNGIYQNIEIENGQIRELENENFSLQDSTKKQIEDILKAAKMKADVINSDSRNLTEKSLSAMKEELESNLKLKIEGDRKSYMDDSIEIFKNFVEKFSLKNGLDEDLKLIFEKNWSQKTSEMMKKYND
jgi:F-type H+-transporting ATPase subunit b